MLRAIFGRLPGEPLPDIGKFPPEILTASTLLLLEAEESAGFPENAWVGKRLRVGDAVFQVAMKCARCVMTTHAFADLPEDPKLMRTLVKENDGDLGVYAAVERPGTVRAGDAVEVMGDSGS